VNPLDGLTQGKPYTLRAMTGLRAPRTTRLGVDVADQVEAAGRNVTQFRPGDQVFGFCLRDPLAPGCRSLDALPGAFAEYACAPEPAVAAMPGNVTFEQAAAVPVAAVTALQGLRDKGRVRPGQEVLVNAGDARAARDAWSQAVVILDDMRHPDAAAVRAKLSALG
jgi:NADPH:quinone reductase-like Zn-dependent oxidoreductase